MQPDNQDANQSEQPSPEQFTGSASTGRIIRPLSSEDAIRSEAQAAQPELSPENITTQAFSGNPGGLPSSYEQGNLITEPLRHPSQAKPYVPTHIAENSSPSNKGGKKVAFTIMSFIIVAAIGGALYYFLFGSKIAAADLVESTVSKTSYQRPKAWKVLPASLGGIETYVDLGNNGSATKTVTVNESLSYQYVGNNRPKDYYEKIRSMAISKETVDVIRIAFQNGGKECTSDIAFDVKPDTTVNNDSKTIGLALATGSCARADGKYIVKRRSVMGEADGLFRHITIAASESDWSKNSIVFDKMLNSIKPAINK